MMYRFAFCAALVVGIALSTVTPAEAKLTRKETCMETAKIVRIALTLRANGTNKITTSHSLTKGNNKVGDPFVPMVAPLVEWVYTIDGNAIKQPGAPKAVADQYRKECLSYKG